MLELSGGEESEGLRCVVYAMKKFTGGLGDDDDRDRGDNHTWKKYFTRVRAMNNLEKPSLLNFKTATFSAVANSFVECHV